ncbi:hypothetical protein FRC07_015074 [Ceratobasidium sp. 392]|nr:hypothetical protein FRC07_015074 [Ceratobasidium sp. 392]
MATSPKSRGRKSAAKNGKQVAEEVVEEAPVSEQEEEDEEGYEVESILNAKYAYNKRGKWSYFVHWKGYGSEEDMWIDEDDAGGAEELIQEWHEKNDMPRDGKGKKKPAAKKPRGSAAAATKDKKRKASSTDGMEVDSPEAEEPPAKKPAKRSTKPAPASPEPEPEPEASDADAEGDVEFAAMDEFMTKANWEKVIKSIETVEGGNGEPLVALITRKDGLKSKCETAILAERCPQLLIEFYERHLKWRPGAEGEGEGEEE